MITFLYLTVISAFILCTTAAIPLRPEPNETFIFFGRIFDKLRPTHVNVYMARNFTDTKNANQLQAFLDGKNVVEIILDRTDKQMRYEVRGGKCNETTITTVPAFWTWCKNAKYVEMPDRHGDLWEYIDEAGDEYSLLVDTYDANHLLGFAFTSKDKTRMFEIAFEYFDQEPILEQNDFIVPKLCT